MKIGDKVRSIIRIGGSDFGLGVVEDIVSVNSPVKFWQKAIVKIRTPSGGVTYAFDCHLEVI